MSQSFADLGVSSQVANALAKRGIHKPFAVQRLAIADVLAGRDVLVQSPTGSGKTLAFGVPIADRLEPGWARPSALVLAPTRELAAQIVDEVGAVVGARGPPRSPPSTAASGSARRSSAHARRTSSSPRPGASRT